MSESTTPPRRFAPQPIETSTKSSRKSANEESTSTSKPRFRPEPLETMRRSNKKTVEPQNTSTAKPAPRRFTPQLIETSTRSRKSGDARPALLPSDKTDKSPGDDIRQPRQSDKGNKGRSPVTGVSVLSQKLSPLRRAKGESPLALHSPARQHSYIPPALEPIESSQSEESDQSNCPSLSTSPSVSSDEFSESYSHASRIRESCDDRFSGYLLALAARAAEKQLKEQALAAFPNEDYHETVDHFVDRVSSSSEEEELANLDEDVEMMGIDSDEEVNLAFKEMRRQQEQRQNQRQLTLRGEADSRPGEASGKSFNPFGQFAQPPKEVRESWQKGIGLERMRRAASPPMLGWDIKFPRCRSPEQTQLHVGQIPRSQQMSRANSGHQAGMWGEPNSSRKSTKGQGGLWMGLCTAEDDDPLHHPPPQVGLITPAAEKADPFAPEPQRPHLTSANFLSPLTAQTLCTNNLPPTPAPTSAPTSAPTPAPTSTPTSTPHVDTEKIDHEFDDVFVSQVYNYLSLGYPALAHKYDPELSKISHISIEELRQDDKLADGKGYVRIDDEPSTDLRDGIQNQCARWKALKTYIKEWARQSPDMTDGPATADAWGARARRGSWAV